MDIMKEGKQPWHGHEVTYLIIEGDVAPEALLPEELALVGERHHPRRRRRYCQGRWGVQEALRKAGFDEVVGTPINMDMQGRPFWGGGKNPDVSFSITHHAAMTMVAVAPGAVSIGVDLETIDPRFERPLEPILTPLERHFLDSLGEPESMERVWGATAIWVAKEALAKGTGKGWMAHQQDFPLYDLKIEDGCFLCHFKEQNEWQVVVEEWQDRLMAFAGKI